MKPHINAPIEIRRNEIQIQETKDLGEMNTRKSIGNQEYSQLVFGPTTTNAGVNSS